MSASTAAASSSTSPDAARRSIAPRCSRRGRRGRPARRSCPSRRSPRPLRRSATPRALARRPGRGSDVAPATVAASAALARAGAALGLRAGHGLRDRLHQRLPAPTRAARRKLGPARRAGHDHDARARSGTTPSSPAASAASRATWSCSSRRRAEQIAAGRRARPLSRCRARVLRRGGPRLANGEARDCEGPPGPCAAIRATPSVAVPPWQAPRRDGRSPGEILHRFGRRLLSNIRRNGWRVLGGEPVGVQRRIVSAADAAASARAAKRSTRARVGAGRQRRAPATDAMASHVVAIAHLVDLVGRRARRRRRDRRRRAARARSAPTRPAGVGQRRPVGDPAADEPERVEARLARDGRRARAAAARASPPSPRRGGRAATASRSRRRRSQPARSKRCSAAARAHLGVEVRRAAPARRRRRR